MRRALLVLALLGCGRETTAPAPTAAPPPPAGAKDPARPGIRNLIVVIGDGMGPGHVALGRTRRPEGLGFERLPVHTQLDTSSLATGPTDSAASATAIATGTRVTNGAIAMDAAGRPLPTLFEHAHRLGKSIGVVTTTSLHDATPAAFTTHAADRSDAGSIIRQMVETKLLDLALGGGRADWDRSGATGLARERGFTLIHDGTGLRNAAPASRVLGLFVGKHAPTGNAQLDALLDDTVEGGLSVELGRPADSEPRLPELAGEALRVLTDDDDGFALLVENEHIDTLAHLSGGSQTAADLLAPYLTAEVTLLDETVAAIVAWIERQPDPEATLLVVTADHETCGLQIAVADGRPKVTCTAGTSHTAAHVDAWARGRGSDRVGAAKSHPELQRALLAALGG